MQYRPNAAELLQTIADLLEVEVLPAVPPALAHRVRVAGNLARILERESRLGPAADRNEQHLLAGLLGHEGELADQRAELSRRLRTGEDRAFEAEAWQVLVEVVRADLAVAKPGHDRWEGS